MTDLELRNDILDEKIFRADEIDFYSRVLGLALVSSRRYTYPLDGPCKMPGLKALATFQPDEPIGCLQLKGAGAVPEYIHPGVKHGIKRKAVRNTCLPKMQRRSCVN